jgi:hypothetical protein
LSSLLVKACPEAIEGRDKRENKNIRLYIELDLTSYTVIRDKTGKFPLHSAEQA